MKLSYFNKKFKIFMCGHFLIFYKQMKHVSGFLSTGTEVFDVFSRDKPRPIVVEIQASVVFRE